MGVVVTEPAPAERLEPSLSIDYDMVVPGSPSPNSMEPTPEPKEPTPEPKEPTPEYRIKVKEPTPEPKEPTPPPMPSTPPPEEVESILERMSTMGCDCEESDPPLLTSIPVRKSTPQPSNDDDEETRSQRRERILAAQREAMWSDDEESVAAITSRVDQLKALLVSCPEANRDFVNGHIVSLQAEVAVLKAASRAVQTVASRSNTPRDTPTHPSADEESDQEESEGEEEEELSEAESDEDEEWGSDDEISDLSDIQALIAEHGL